jgi:hypothetical protein
MQMALIRGEYATKDQKEGDVADILPDDHVFSDTEKRIFLIITISDTESNKIDTEIEEYHKIAVATGSMPRGIKKYYDGKLKWQTV